MKPLSSYGTIVIILERKLNKKNSQERPAHVSKLPKNKTSKEGFALSQALFHLSEPKSLRLNPLNVSAAFKKCEQKFSRPAKTLPSTQPSEPSCADFSYPLLVRKEGSELQEDAPQEEVGSSVKPFLQEACVRKPIQILNPSDSPFERECHSLGIVF